MAYTQADIDRLQAALARGVTRARVGDEEVQYASMAEMRRQLGVMQAELTGQDRGRLQPQYPRTTRGL